MKKLEILFIIAVLLNTAVSGQELTIEVTGVVTSVESGGGLSWDGSVTEGTLMSGSCSYDTEAISTDGYNYPLLSITMIVGDYIFKHNVFATDLASFRTGADKVYAAVTWDGVFEGDVFDDGEIKTFDEIEWYRTTYFELFNIYSTLPECPYSNDLPESIDLSLFNERKEFRARFSKADDISSRISFLGELTSLTVIPEPCSLVLLGLGSIALLRKRRLG